MIESIVLIVLLMLPAWFPAVRLGYMLSRGKFQIRPFVVLYLLSFSWTLGGVLFSWIAKVPSGIPYGIVLLIAWPLFLCAGLGDTLPERPNAVPKE